MTMSDQADHSLVATTCEHCVYGHKFTPRPDELMRFGASVMGCKLRNYEGYTKTDSTCISFAVRAHLEKQDGTN